ncbi:LemA family protein [candidate division WWE3 bacterium]|uniref:LemA family protein n=1 Tax=candidate division WWE3 bacterium TaxID=2053526 RepID=A0A955LKQ4_UNCKA|nr:LemA family protein [candidate division WWE3 bacterium]
MIFIAGLIVLVVVYVWFLYNQLVTARLRVDESWSGIDVQLKRRSSLIPNLVETVKGYASHEKEVFEKVTEARSQLVNAQSPAQKAQADNMLSGALKSLFAVAEAYPELKASDNFKQLQSELADTEDKIAYARQFYNQNVMDYNTKIQMFPNVVIANLFNFTSREFFKADEEERADVKVSFKEDQKPSETQQS